MTAVSVPRIEARIQIVRALRVMVDADLAEIYGVPTKRLNEQVKRNSGRFPADFMFQLTAAEKAEVVANCDHLQKPKFSKALPFAFTEHGAMQAANVLGGPRRLAQARALLSAWALQRRRMTDTMYHNQSVVSPCRSERGNRRWYGTRTRSCLR